MSDSITYDKAEVEIHKLLKEVARQLSEATDPVQRALLKTNETQLVIQLQIIAVGRRLDFLEDFMMAGGTRGTDQKTIN